MIFISGGVRSGKSSLAEQMAQQMYAEQNASALYYMATTKRNHDKEMNERIKLHQASRSESWITVEEPLYIDDRINELQSHSILLIDCLTVWSSNVLFSENAKLETMVKRVENLVQTAKDKNIAVIFVSNDLNEDIPIKDSGVQEYVFSLEAVHKCVVQLCDQAFQVIAGCPIRWK
ncbi:bifunctional adenosylcobinamide kinase/adenosylcobinamide-phosphate guanylyltransferase [Bacillus sp. AGMB 02131]|uniref:Adenosylcobinamide kinase n=1 Tax=Peribacillus faecalis TaxID=2772559 RepID=A0A927HAN6_9BACI|nr:bifunctional adenosylcobinamide kinase/adenosylcobinamide-phosphate guanylyltransferase [Peribacillus faecalis]MBD3107737.1 bifunctional adenosylcobinamide kinase/adenosylcobinamide-phosphate guanylyltransferase [Peribacillus faecalis]